KGNFEWDILFGFLLLPYTIYPLDNKNSPTVLPIPDDPPVISTTLRIHNIFNKYTIAILKISKLVILKINLTLNMIIKSKFILLVVISLFNTSFLLAQTSKDRVKEMMDNLSQDELVKHLSILASDEMEGRKTGEKGQKLAANYIRNFYKSLEIEPLPGTDDY